MSAQWEPVPFLARYLVLIIAKSKSKLGWGFWTKWLISNRIEAPGEPNMRLTRKLAHPFVLAGGKLLTNPEKMRVCWSRALE